MRLGSIGFLAFNIQVCSRSVQQTHDAFSHIFRSIWRAESERGHVMSTAASRSVDTHTQAGPIIAAVTYGVCLVPGVLLTSCARPLDAVCLRRLPCRRTFPPMDRTVASAFGCWLRLLLTDDPGTPPPTHTRTSSVS